MIKIHVIGLLPCQNEANMIALTIKNFNTGSCGFRISLVAK